MIVDKLCGLSLPSQRGPADRNDHWDAMLIVHFDKPVGGFRQDRTFPRDQGNDRLIVSSRISGKTTLLPVLSR
jgi:hypothetical protein